MVNKTKDRFLYILVGIIIISRQIVISILIEYAVFMFIQKKNRIKISKILVITIIVIIGFGIVGNFRSGDSTMSEIFYAKKQYEDIPNSLKWIYSYMTFSITNLDNLINITNGGINNGASMISELIPTVLVKAANIKIKYQPYYLELINFNVSTYLPPIYLDFGVAGIVVFNTIMGLIGGRLFYDISNKKNIKYVYLYCVYVHNILLLFFVNMFLYLPVIVQFVYINLIFSKQKNNYERIKINE